MAIKYKDWSPTSFDSKGLNADTLTDDLGSLEEWLVLPVIQTRDSGPFDKANFDALLEEFGGEENEQVEVHRFGHWGPGWIEIILVHPDLEDKVDEWIEKLEDYSIVDEMKLSEYELEDQGESWKTWAGSDWNDMITDELDYEYPELAEHVRDNQEITDTLWYEIIAPSLNWDVEQHDEGVHFNLDEGLELFIKKLGDSPPSPLDKNQLFFPCLQGVRSDYQRSESREVWNLLRKCG